MIPTKVTREQCNFKNNHISNLSTMSTAYNISRETFTTSENSVPSNMLTVDDMVDILEELYIDYRQLYLQTNRIDQVQAVLKKLFFCLTSSTFPNSTSGTPQKMLSTFKNRGKQLSYKDLLRIGQNTLTLNN